MYMQYIHTNMQRMFKFDSILQDVEQTEFLTELQKLVNKQKLADKIMYF